MAHSLDRRALLASAAALAASAAAPRLAFGQTVKPTPVTDQPPVARVAPVTENYYGTTVVDPYRWMESESPEWKAYAEAEGAYARKVLDAIPGRDALYKAIDHNSGLLVAVNNVALGGELIFTESRPLGAATFKLYVRKGPGGTDRLLIDPDTYAAAGSHASLDWWAPSPDGSHVVFGTSPGGSENSLARILVVDTGAVLPETIDRTQDASPSWAPDGAGFFYNRLQPGVAADSLDRYKLSACWYHKLNTDPATDVKVLAKNISPAVGGADIDFPVAFATPGSDIAIGALQSGVQNEQTLYACKLGAAMAGGAPPWQPICLPADDVTNVAVAGHDIYLLSHKGASHYQVLKATGADPSVADAKLVVPESASVIRSFAAARDGLYLQDLNAGLGGVRRLGWDGKVTTIAMPFDGAIASIYADTLHDGVWFILEGWARPAVVCYAGAGGDVTQTDIAPKPAIDVSPYASVEVMYPAADGVKVPLSILYRKDLKRDGTAPCILDAYGSYGITEDPAFLGRYLPFIDLGGIFATAHVRGGGELGEDWHLAGQKLTKPNTWRDDIAAAEFLIREGWTSKAKLAIMGGSAGGITVGRFMTERPDLPAVVIDQVGVSNATRSEFSPNGPPNIPEFGTVTNEAGFKGLYEMDAMLHVKDGVKYPSIMLTTGLNDPRVSSWEPTKMCARLQAATASGNPVILRVEGDAGHGIGSTRGQRDEELADTFAFILWRTGDPHYQP